ncbi:MAG: glycosyltransferase family 9 protein [Verrucomicrobiota bacterium]
MSASSPPGKVLLIKPSAFGDVVQALPVAASLKQAWPGVTLHWVLNEHFRELLADNRHIDRLVLYPRQRWRFPSSLPSCVEWGRALRAENYDLVIDLQGLLRSGLMTHATHAPRRLGLASAREGARFFYNEVARDEATAAFERYLSVLHYLEIVPEAADFGFPTKLVYKQPKISLPYIALHPYSRWRTKLWPYRYYQELVAAMPQVRFAVVGRGPWFPLAGPNVHDLRNRQSLTELKATLAHAAALLSTDSGPAHLGAAMGTPTHVLFGATDWRRTKPVGPKVSIQTNDVFCSPCLKRTCRRDQPMECMRGLLPRMVAKRLLPLVQEAETAPEN